MTAVLLPERGDGSRRQRREEARRRRRVQRTVLAVGLAAASLVGYVALKHNSPGYLRPTFAESTTTSVTTSVAVVGPPPGLVVVVDDTGAVQSATVLAVAPAGQGGDFVHVPTGTLLESVAGPKPLREVAAAEGLAAVRDGVGRVLGVDLVAVELTIQRAPAGLSASGTADLATIAADQVVWDRWLAAIRAGSESDPSPAVLGELADELLALAEGRVDHHVLPVESIGAGVERVRVADLDGLVARVFPGRAESQR